MVRACRRSRREFGTALALLILVISLPAHSKRPYTVDDLLRLEDAGRAGIGRQGHIVFELLRPYDEAPEFGRATLLGRERSRLLLFDPKRPDRPRPLFPQEKTAAWWLGAFSPDGGRVTAFGLEEGQIRLGVVDIGGRRLTRLQDTPAIPAYAGIGPVWIDDDRLLYAALPPGRRPFLPSLGRAGAERLPAEWRKARAGRQATSDALGGGALPALESVPAAKEGYLVLADLRRRSRTRLADGLFVQLSPSPDRRTAALLRQGPPLPPDPARALNLFEAWHRHRLVLAATGGRPRAFTVCPSCDVLTGSLQWSANGQELLFVARRDGEFWEQAKLYRYLLSGRTLRTVEAKGLIPDLASASGAPHRTARAAWFGEKVAVFGRGGKDGRTDLFAVEGNGAAVNLTASLPGPPQTLLAAHGDTLYVLSGGDLWRLGAAGTPENLSTEIDAPLVPLLVPPAPGSPARNGLQVRRLRFTARSGTKAQALSLDLEAGSWTRLDLPDGKAELLALSARTAVLRGKRDMATLLTALLPGGRQIRLARLNGHLADVETGRAIALERPEAEERTLIDWLLLPPGHRQGQRHPVVLYLYPGTVFDARMPADMRAPFDPARLSPLNLQVLAAGGYAVLAPSLPLKGPSGAEPEAMSGLAAMAEAALVNAARKGYVDPERAGLLGQSFGGYGVLSLLTRTDRFRAAVASASLSNLSSLYGAFAGRDRAGGLEWTIVEARMIESGQLRLGAPPWEDPDRYVRNSPLFRAHKIRTPLMLTHGDLDSVSITQAEEMFTALRRQGKDVLFVRYWGEGHLLAAPANIRDYWRRVTGWYDRYLTAAR